MHYHGSKPGFCTCLSSAPTPHEELISRHLLLLWWLQTLPHAEGTSQVPGPGLQPQHLVGRYRAIADSRNEWGQIFSPHCKFAVLCHTQIARCGPLPLLGPETLSPALCMALGSFPSTLLGPSDSAPSNHPQHPPFQEIFLFLVSVDCPFLFQLTAMYLVWLTNIIPIFLMCSEKWGKVVVFIWRTILN